MRFIGFDTSNYTTSVGVWDDGELRSYRRILDVKKGERGLRQSDALFAHVKALPDIISMSAISGSVDGVGVSTRPRNVDGSYMPVFLAGAAAASAAASCAGVPLYKFSHQEGHIMAGIYSSGAFELLDGEFLSVHLSGGTTEILKTEFSGGRFVSEIVGGTKDISAGQLIDRVGVLLGYKFPCGAELDRLSANAAGKLKFRTSVDGGYFNLSGLENKAAQSGEEPGETAFAVFSAIAETLNRSLQFCMNRYRTGRVLLVGGVASNTYIRKALKTIDCDGMYFSSPELSSDNACGVAALAAHMYAAEKGIGLLNGDKNSNSIANK